MSRGRSIVDRPAVPLECAKCLSTSHLVENGWSPYLRGVCAGCTRDLRRAEDPGVTAPGSPVRAEKPKGKLLISASPDTVTLQPGQGAFIPVEKTGDSFVGPSGQSAAGKGLHWIVQPARNIKLDPAPGTWGRAQTSGPLLVTNMTDLDVDINLGDIVAGVYPGYAQTRTCLACEAVDHEAVFKGFR